MIRERELMERYDANRGQIREALMRLEMNGLVRIIPNIGTIVEDVSFQNLKAVFEVSSHLVRLTGKLAAERITDEELADIRNSIDQMRLVEDGRQPDSDTTRQRNSQNNK